MANKKERKNKQYNVKNAIKKRNNPRLPRTSK